MTEQIEQKSLIEGLEELTEISETLDIDNQTQNKATELFRKSIANGDLIKEYGITVTIGACILLASRLTANPLTAEKIAAELDSPLSTKKSLLTHSQSIRKKLDLGLILTDPHDLLDKACDDLQTPPTLKEEAHSLITKIQQTHIVSGMNAKTIASSCLYIIGCIAGPTNKRYHTQKEIRNSLNVSEIALRDGYQKIQDFIEPNIEEYIDTSRLRSLRI